MKNLQMFCISLEPSHYNFIKKLGYMPVGLWEKYFDEKSKGVFGPWNKNNTNGISKYRHLVYKSGMLIFNLLRRPLFNKIYNGKYNIV